MEVYIHITHKTQLYCLLVKLSRLYDGIKYINKNNMTSDASVPELAAFIKVCSLSDYIDDPLQEVHSAH